jgi:hypothetical protein
MKTSKILLSRTAWTLWALVPVGLLTFHFGPGQAAFREDRAARLVKHAETLQGEAVALQEVAYETHLTAITARIAAFGKDDAALRDAATAATAREEAAYGAAAAAWRKTADALSEAQAIVDEQGGAVRDEIRLAKARALVRTGEIDRGTDELEAFLDEAGTRGDHDGPLPTAAREELATAYYYGARLLRLAGKPAEEWREIASRARQNYRYLAEQAKARGAAGELVSNYEKNGELVLDLEQSSLEELFAKPKPRDSPSGNCNGLGQKAGKGKKPGQKPGNKPSNGAGMKGEIGHGW